MRRFIGLAAATAAVAAPLVFGAATAAQAATCISFVACVDQNLPGPSQACRGTVNYCPGQNCYGTINICPAVVEN